MAAKSARWQFLRLRAHPLRIGMRFWLPLAFALIAAVTALMVSWVFGGRSENALRGSARDLARANTLGAVDSVVDGKRRGNLAATLDTIAERRRLAIFYFDEGGRLASA